MMRTGYLLLVMLLCTNPALAEESSIDLLKRMNHAASTLNYDGVFIHIDNQRIDTLRLIHKIQDGNGREESEESSSHSQNLFVVTQ